jgi:CheY-like chemotaxis protein
MNPITRILILDSDHKFAETLGRLLELYYRFVKVTIAFTGLGAVHLVTGGMFDIVFIHLNLEEDDGVDVATAIRTCCGAEWPKLIAMSGCRTRIAAERLAPLFDRALVKPLVIEELFEAIAGF